MDITGERKRMERQSKKLMRSLKLEVLMYFIAIMPMGRRMRTSKDGHIGC